MEQQTTYENVIQYITNAPSNICTNVLNFDQTVNNLLMVLSITNYVAECGTA